MGDEVAQLEVKVSGMIETSNNTFLLVIVVAHVMDIGQNKQSSHPGSPFLSFPFLTFLSFLSFLSFPPPNLP